MGLFKDIEFSPPKGDNENEKLLRHHPHLQTLLTSLSTNVSNNAKEGRDSRIENKEQFSDAVEASKQYNIDVVDHKLQEENAKGNQPPLSDEVILEALQNNLNPKHRAEKLMKEKGITNRRLAVLYAQTEYNRIQTYLESIDIVPEKVLPPTKSRTEHPIIYPVGSIMAIVGELPFSLAVMKQVLPVSTGMLMLISVFIAAMFFASSHFAAKAWVLKDIKAAIIALGIGILCLFVQVSIRFSMPGSAHALMSILNFAIYLFGLLWAYWHHKHKYTWQAWEILTTEGGIILENEAAIDDQELDTDILKAEQDQEIHKMAEDIKKGKEQEEIDRHKRVAELEAEKLSIEKNHDKIEQYGHMVIDEAHQKGRNKAAPSYKNGGWAAILILLLSLMSFPACNTLQDPQPTIEVLDGMDASKSNGGIIRQDFASLNDAIQDRLQLNDDSKLYHGRVLHVSYIGSNSRPIITTVTLKPGPDAILDRVEKTRKEDIQKFTNEVETVLQRIYDMPDTQSHTCWVEAQCSFIQKLKSTDSSNHKELILIGDGIPSSTISFDKYKSRAEFLKSFEEIMKEMDSYCDPVDLKQLKVIHVASQPLNPNTVITPQDIASYWHYYYTSKNGRYEVISNL